MQADRSQIAASGRPGALTLIHKILPASAVLPVAFPPVIINVEADGRQYQEMSVDGGAGARVSVTPSCSERALAGTTC
jgi:predicted acylesterase/phospholipase RssA